MATIIRKDNPRETPTGRTIQPVSFSFEDMRGQAGDYLDLVRQEAAKIIQEAHQQAEQIHRRAEAAGRKAAEAAIERILDEKVAKRMTTLLPALEQMVAQINDTKGELLTQWERSAVKVSTAIAERIIRRQLEHEPQISLDLIAEALRLAAGSAEITLHVNPTDYENLGSQIQRLAESLCQLAPTDIRADAEISPGGCRVETRYGEIDQQIESQLRRIEEDLKLKLEQSVNHPMHMDVLDNLNEAMTTALVGSVVETVGMTTAVADFPAPVGALVSIERESGAAAEGEVIGFRNGLTLIYMLTAIAGVRRGNRVRLAKTSRMLRVGDDLLGRVIDARGQCIDGRSQPLLPYRVRQDRLPPPATERPRIRTPLSTGVQAIDALLTCGRGQRIGIFSGSGVGKSVLLGMMCRHTNADVIVTGLIGERGREVNEFLERDLGADGRARSVVVVATSNEPALTRVQAAYTATAVAEYFRDQGKQVLLLMDSVTRFAMAQREIGLAAGEPPTTRGYPPSMFALLPRLVERAGQSRQGSITAFYTVLVEGDDENEPVADTMRGLLDGHVWLSRKLAGRGHYPAIDVLTSISRLMNDITSEAHQAAALVIRQLLAAYAEHEDLLSIGAYRRGSNRTVDAAVDMREAIDALLRQKVSAAMPFEKVVEQLVALASQCQAKMTATTLPPATLAPA